MKFKSLILGTSVLATGFIGAPALAQDDEIVITATKREQTLQEVPVAVTVTDAETIEKAEIRDILDLQSVVPSLRVNQLQNSAQTDFIIRGFGNGANNAGIEPSVGVFIDGVYRSRSAAQIADLPNLERVEVLRGPQSTLFGKNASAGVISVVTSAPSFEWEGYAEAGIGNFNSKILKGYVTGPISERLAFSLGASHNERDGYTENVALGTDISDRDRQSVRGQLLWEPNDNASFRIIADYDQLDEVCCTVANLVNGPTGAAIPLLGGSIVAEDPFSYEVALNFDPTNEAENKGVSGHLDWDFGNITMTSITAVRSSEIEREGDVDFNAADLIGSNAQTLDVDTFTQEIRFASNNDGPLNWLVGAFYFDETVKQEDSIRFGTAFRQYANILADPDLSDGVTDTISGLEFSLGAGVGTTFFQPGDGVFEFGRQENQAFSLFGQADYELSDRLTATIGLNYTQDEKTVSLNQLNTDPFSQLDFVAIGFGGLFSALTGGAGDPTNPADFAAFPAQFAAATAAATTPCTATSAPGTCNTALGLTALQFLPQLAGFDNAKSDDDNVDYTFRLAYDATDSVNVYASYATGYKATSWNLSRDSRPTEAELDATFGTATPDIFGRNLRPGQPHNLSAGTRLAGPEEAEVIELGLKARFDGGSVNVAVFDQTITDFQANTFTGDAFVLDNADKQSVKGLEVDAIWNPTDTLTFGFAGTFLDPEFDSFPTATAVTAAGSTVPVDLSGVTVGGIHQTSLTTSVNWDWTANGYDGYIRADYQYEESVDIQTRAQLFDSSGAPVASLLDLAGTQGADKREINIVNVGAGFSKDGWDISFYGRNIFEDEYISTIFPTTAQPGSVNGYPSPPRTYGVNLRKNF
jgi:outer membrane receptor protein involved in Fe transport